MNKLKKDKRNAQLLVYTKLIHISKYLAYSPLILL